MHIIDRFVVRLLPCINKIQSHDIKCWTEKAIHVTFLSTGKALYRCQLDKAPFVLASVAGRLLVITVAYQRKNNIIWHTPLLLQVLLTYPVKPTIYTSTY